MSRPANVGPGAGSWWSAAGEGDDLLGAAEQRHGGGQEAVVGADERGGGGGDGEEAAVGADAGVDDGEHHTAVGEVLHGAHEGEPAGPHVVGRQVVGDVDDAQTGREAQHHGLADADELVDEAVIGEEGDRLQRSGRQLLPGLGVPGGEIGVDVDVTDAKRPPHAHRWQVPRLDQPIHGHRRDTHEIGHFLHRQEARRLQTSPPPSSPLSAARGSVGTGFCRRVAGGGTPSPSWVAGSEPRPGPDGGGRRGQRRRRAVGAGRRGRRERTGRPRRAASAGAGVVEVHGERHGGDPGGDGLGGEDPVGDDRARGAPTAKSHSSAAAHAVLLEEGAARRSRRRRRAATRGSGPDFVAALTRRRRADPRGSPPQPAAAATVAVQHEQRRGCRRRERDGAAPAWASSARCAPARHGIPGPVRVDGRACGRLRSAGDGGERAEHLVDRDVAGRAGCDAARRRRAPSSRPRRVVRWPPHAGADEAAPRAPSGGVGARPSVWTGAAERGREVLGDARGWGGAVTAAGWPRRASRERAAAAATASEERGADATLLEHLQRPGRRWSRRAMSPAARS